MYTLGMKYYSGYKMPLFIRRNESLIPELHSAYYKMVLVTTSGNELVINHRTYVIASPSIIFLNENDRLSAVGQDSAVIYFLPEMVNRFFTITLLNKRDKRIMNMDESYYLYHFLRSGEEGPKVIELDNSLMYRISNIIEKMEDQLRIQPDNYWPCRSKAFLIEILFQLCYPSHQMMSDDIIKEEDVLDRILFFIQQHISEKISINRICKEFSINRTALDQKFKKYLKITPIKYINLQRIELSKLVLANTAVPVTEVCLKVGIDSPAHFSKIFKAATGLSPTKYRSIKSDTTSMSI